MKFSLSIFDYTFTNYSYGVSKSYCQMPIDRQKNKQLKVTIPNDLHRKLKIISEKIGIPMAQMLLQSAVEKYREELKELDQEE
ncbi:MAG: hypothetical protein RID53_18280 [Coleofasciculus sp. B1-GNL1-01]|uniref:hypothetical protein n=1 Tax=Coleofasciculus sp. B1-GNL1-01 TaxID=3068484 RepID=UPI0032F45E3B